VGQQLSEQITLLILNYYWLQTLDILSLRHHHLFTFGGFQLGYKTINMEIVQKQQRSHIIFE
jgi:hypothetical protein